MFSGRGFTSEVIRVFTRSPWSHIGMVVHLPGNPDPLVLESTTLSESSDVTLTAPPAVQALIEQWQQQQTEDFLALELGPRSAAIVWNERGDEAEVTQLLDDLKRLLAV